MVLHQEVICDNLLVSVLLSFRLKTSNTLERDAPDAAENGTFHEMISVRSKTVNYI